MSTENEAPDIQAGAQPCASTGTEPLDSDYKRLKELDDLLDFSLDKIDEAEYVYEEALKEFATLCHELWQKEKHQGSRKDKGFRSALKKHGITKVGRAYRAMKKFFATDFPAKPKPTATSSAANEVPGRQPIVQFTGKTLPGDVEILECLFPFTTDEKAEVQECLGLLTAEVVKRAFVAAVKQAAETMRGQQADLAAAQQGLEAAQAASGPTEQAEARPTQTPRKSLAFLDDEDEPSKHPNHKKPGQVSDLLQRARQGKQTDQDGKECCRKPVPSQNAEASAMEATA